MAADLKYFRGCLYKNRRRYKVSLWRLAANELLYYDTSDPSSLNQSCSIRLARPNRHLVDQFSRQRSTRSKYSVDGSRNAMYSPE
jgi:hypothetical protein